LPDREAGGLARQAEARGQGIYGLTHPDGGESFTGMADLDRGEFAVVDGERYWMGGCEKAE
jgi:hypothetical protein